MRIDLALEPEGTRVYHCPSCGRQNLEDSDMIFQNSSASPNLQAFQCRDCYETHKATEEQARRQESQEREQAQRTAVQEAYRRIQQET